MKHKLLACCLFVFSMPSMAGSPKLGVWYGTIADHPVMLCVERGKAAYYYSGQSTEIALNVKNAGTWTESVGGKTTGVWTIEDRSEDQFFDNTIDGSWRRGKGKAADSSIDLHFLEGGDASCSSESYRQTLLVPGEPRLSLPLPSAEPAVLANDDAAVALSGTGELLFWSKNQPQPRPIGTGYVRIALGDGHFLGIKGDGSLWGWGSNSLGQLGGERVSGDAPVRMGDGYVAVAANDGLSLAIRRDGTLWAWGGLSTDAKGNVLGEKSAKPTLIGKGFVSVSAGDSSFGAIKSDGSLWTWGGDSDGQLGLGDGGSWFRRTYSYEQLPTRAGQDFAQVSAGYSHAAAIKKDGSLWTWGHGIWGALGNGSTDKGSRTPVRVGDGYSQAVAGFLNTAAVKTDGSLWLWGGNTSGMFGDCTTQLHATPVRVGEGFVQVALGHTFLVALKKDGSIWTLGWEWEDDPLDVPKACRKIKRVAIGDGRSRWEKPAGGPVRAELPAPPMPASILGIAAGGSHSAVVKQDGTLWTWGNNEFGQLALGTNQNYSQPQKSGGVGYAHVMIDGNYTLASKRDGVLEYWGADPATFPAGDFSKDPKRAFSPVIVYAGTSTVLRSGYQMTRGLGLRPDGTILDWPYIWDLPKSPQVFGSDVRQIAASQFGSFAIRNDGSLWELAQYPIKPPPKIIGANFTSIAAGVSHAYGIKADGSLWAWGRNESYQLGDGTKTGRADPVKIGTGFVQVAAGRLHGIALASNGSIWTWGNNEVGAIGDGTKVTRTKPTKVGDGFSMVAAGEYHNLALKADGSLWAWGANEEGQLGDGTTITRLAPVRVSADAGKKSFQELPSGAGAPSPANSITGVRVGLYFACASFQDDRYMCWGSNGEGQLGNDRRLDANPAPIVVEQKEGVAALFRSGRLMDCRAAVKACGKVFARYPYLRGASHVVSDADGAACAMIRGKIRCGDQNSSSARIVDGIHDAISFDYYGGNGCALLRDGRVKCWGGNMHGELGNGTTESSPYYSDRSIANEVIGLAATAGQGKQ